MSSLRIYLRVIGLLRSQAVLAGVLAIANVVIAGTQFAEPVLFGRIIDRLTHGVAAARFADVLPLLGAWILFGLFSIVAAVLVALHADRLAHRRRLAVTALFFEHVLHLPMSFHARVHSGATLKVMIEGANGMAGLWLSFFRENCASLVALLVLLPASLFLNWRLALLMIVLVAIFAALLVFVLRRTEQMQQTVEAYNTRLAERASDALGNVPVVQSFTQIERETRALHDLIAALLKAQVPVLSWWAAAAVATRTAATLTLLGIFVLGIVLQTQGTASIGEIVTFMNLATMLVARLEQVVGFTNLLFMEAPKLQNFFDVLDTAPHVADRPDARDPGRLAGHVVFEDVSFGYVPGQVAIANVGFDARPGETIALVGATGSGKSTTVGLLHRIGDPLAGRISIDGIDIRDMTLTGLRRNIGVVFQEPMLFARSIEENLRVGSPDASDAEIARALDRAQATDFVGRQREGLGTTIGERGRMLSGGERQRLSIARALLKDPPVLVFDEATAALDAATEARLQAAMDEATAGRTTFVVAHRLATVRKATQILVFDEGRIVERGSFDELVAAGGRFATIARMQLLAPPDLAGSG